MDYITFDIQKAQEEEGRMHILAKISDTQTDRTFDQFSKRGLKDMLKQLKKGVELMNSHRDGIGFGISTEKSFIDDDGNNASLIADFILDDDSSFGKKLFMAASSEAGTDKQFSVGGEFSSEPGAREFRGGIMIIHKVDLDHVAVTRKDKAANPRAGVVAAMIKDSDGELDPGNITSIAEDHRHDIFSDGSTSMVKDHVHVLGMDGKYKPFEDHTHGIVAKEASYDDGETLIKVVKDSDEVEFRFPHRTEKDKLSKKGVAKAIERLLLEKDALKHDLAVHCASHLRQHAIDFEIDVSELDKTFKDNDSVFKEIGNMEDAKKDNAEKAVSFLNKLGEALSKSSAKAEEEATASGDESAEGTEGAEDKTKEDPTPEEAMAKNVAEKVLGLLTAKIPALAKDTEGADDAGSGEPAKDEESAEGEESTEKSTEIAKAIGKLQKTLEGLPASLQKSNEDQLVSVVGELGKHFGTAFGDLKKHIEALGVSGGGKKPDEVEKDTAGGGEDVWKNSLFSAFTKKKTGE